LPIVGATTNVFPVIVPQMIRVGNDGGVPVSAAVPDEMIGVDVAVIDPAVVGSGGPGCTGVGDTPDASTGAPASPSQYRR